MSNLILNNDAMHPELLAIQHIYSLLKLECSQPIPVRESAEYCAYSFKLNNSSIQFRAAKITPTKIGQFVTLWKRSEKGPILPYDSADLVDYVVINTSKEEHFGQFIFPKSVLRNQGVFSVNADGGKRAIRVYPSWDITLNKQAQKTQKWQLEYFLEIPKNGEIDISRAKRLYENK